ncbi:thiopeptide-type bacteriocin biosynthesis domain-containing protein [Pedobacter terrae]|uniref:Thiopeptide-type bacteriocin biosynthesis domain-containing protein n=1 Tax=Pedobacter terrae TaxID=405671 RepID=A0A1G7NHN6_9SPHI|nr:thiopeptide-type bacteriocin biosynthesis protein [Pedobacter terrae]SDF73476.1 thiopeptide-type bacteriocin biosynthesis domain-containing protein [Pedobacter terrae]
MDSTIKSTKYTWLSLHIYYAGNADELLIQAIAPFISKWKFCFFAGSPWFFIRYWEGGSHIRLRLHANSFYHEQISSSLSNDLCQFQSTSFQVEKVLSMKYDPEIIRYGNVESITWAEQHFAASSAYVLNWLLIRKNSSQVTLEAVKLHLVLLFCAGLKPEKIIRLCDFFINGWLPKLYRPDFSGDHEKAFWLHQFEQAFLSKKETVCLAAASFWEELAANSLYDDLAKYMTCSQKVMDQYKTAEFDEFKFQEIVSSLMHMTNNRLGIANQEEAYLMYVIKTCIEYIFQVYHSN